MEKPPGQSSQANLPRKMLPGKRSCSNHGNDKMNIKAQPQSGLIPKAWVVYGFLTLLAFLGVLGVQTYLWLVDVDSEESEAIYLSRTAHPNLQWAFDEWERCNKGAGSYAKDGYFAKDQCDLAVTALGDRRQTGKETREAIETLRANMIAASNSIKPPRWPLSLFF